MLQKPECGLKDDVFGALHGEAWEAAVSRFSETKTLGPEDMKYPNFTFKHFMHYVTMVT